MSNGNTQESSLLSQLFGVVTEVGADVAHQWAAKEFQTDQPYLPSGTSGQPIIAGQAAPVTAATPAYPTFTIFGQTVSRGLVYAVGIGTVALAFTAFLVTRR